MGYLELEQEASEAQRLSNHPMLREAFKAVRERALSKLVSLPVGDPGVTVAHATLKALDDIHAELQARIDNPKMHLHSTKMKKMTGGLGGRT